MKTNLNNFDDTGIVRSGDTELKPSQITLGYLIQDKKVVDKIKDCDYDIQINNVELKELYFLTSEEDLCRVLKQSNVFSVKETVNLSLLNLSSVGMGLSPSQQTDINSQYRYSYLNSFVDCINKAIVKENKKEKSFSEIWEKEYNRNIDKFNVAQCKNAVTWHGLYCAVRHLKILLELAKKTLNQCDNAFEIAQNIKWLYTSTLSLFNNSNKYMELYSVKFGENLFLQLGFELPEFTQNCMDDAVSAKKLLQEYVYFFEFILFCLTDTIKQLKQNRIKRAIDIFNTNGKELKTHTLNAIKNVDYTNAYEYNINVLYDFFRQWIMVSINCIIDRDILRRQVVDGMFQYVPSFAGVIVFVIAMVVAFQFNFTLLKEMQGRFRLLLLYTILTLVAIIALINLYRNAKQFKRPKRKKFSFISLCTYCVMTVMFFSLYSYFINRYDGYNQTYYYVLDNDGNIKIDGLFDSDNRTYQIPYAIDGLKVSQVSSIVFKNNKRITSVDFSDSHATLQSNAFKNCTNLQTVKLSNAITQIPSSAFENCEHLQNISANYVSTIGNSAFRNCDRLSYFDMSNVIELGDNAFQNCTRLQQIEFNDALLTIPNYAFDNCKSIAFDALPKNLVNVGKGAFSNCSLINNIYLTDTVQSIGNNAFDNCSSLETLTVLNLQAVEKASIKNILGNSAQNIQNITIGNASKIEKDCFSQMTNLQNVTVLGEVSMIGDNAFAYCKELEQFNYSGVVEYIGKKAFYNCENLEFFNFQSLNVKSIPEQAFYKCTRLKDITFGNTLEDIGSQAFSGCTQIKELALPDSIRSIGNNAFENCNFITSLSLSLYDNGLKLSQLLEDYAIRHLKTVNLRGAVNIPNNFFDGCVSLTNLQMDITPTKIGDYAFRNCASLQDFTFISNAYKIGNGAFQGCKLLNNIQLSSKLTSIGAFAFSNCVSLETIEIPLLISKLPEGVFSNCIELTDVKISNNVKNIDSTAFNNCKIEEVELPLLNKTIATSLGESALSTLEKIKIYVVDQNKIPDYYLYGANNLYDVTLYGNVNTIGKYAFAHCNLLDTFTIPSSVVRIEDYAFQNCKGLLSIKIPSTAQYIGNAIMQGCTNLQELSFPIANTKSFEHYMPNSSVNSMLTVSIIGDTVPDKYFLNYPSLSKINMDNLKIIGDYAFCNTGIQSLTLHSQLTDVGIGAFSQCKYLTNANIGVMDRLADLLFADCSALQNVQLHSTDIIGKSTFENCTNLKEITGLDKVERVEDYAFNNCRVLQVPTNISYLDYIGQSAFGRIQSVKEVILTNANAVLSQHIFEGCNNLRSLTISQTIQQLDKKGIEYCIGEYVVKNIDTLVVYGIEHIDKNFFAGCDNVEYIQLVGDATEVSQSCFENFTYLQSVELPSTVKIIAQDAFNGCSYLYNINLPQGIEQILRGAFDNCTHLKTVSLPNNVQFIGSRAFASTTVIVNALPTTQDYMDDWHFNWNSRSQTNIFTNFDALYAIIADNILWLIIPLLLVILACVSLIVIRAVIKKRR